MNPQADIATLQLLMRLRRALTAVFLGCLLPACDSHRESPQGPSYGSDADPRPVLRLAIHPLHNPVHLVRTYQPLIDHLQSQLPGYRFELEASRDYDSFERKIDARAPELLLPNPLQTLTAIERDYTVVAMAGDPEEFRGVLLVPVDSPIRHPRDLKGRRVSFPAPTALAAAIMTQRLMQSHALQPGRDVELLYVGSQESSMVAAIQGLSDAASTWLQPWRDFQLDRPQEASRLRVLAITPALVNNAVMVRNDLPAALRTDLARVLLALHLDARQQPVLEAARIRRFSPANNATYHVVRAYLAAAAVPTPTPPAAPKP
ncbi:MAG: phosphate/phosphite/phosphonate ABC transporter substrate-binding protein [Hydrogenophaga sp.]|nr:phosphate/phosphite/phosphonate ABC transporter substrate-binding protein [Hydrogenophaga sp.]